MADVNTLDCLSITEIVARIKHGHEEFDKFLPRAKRMEPVTWLALSFGIAMISWFLVSKHSTQ